ncbi:mCG118534 [Mus musculus]|nr:mCG118534 [Mus musculus]
MQPFPGGSHWREPMMEGLGEAEQAAMSLMKMRKPGRNTDNTLKDMLNLAQWIGRVNLYHHLLENAFDQ